MPAGFLLEFAVKDLTAPTARRSTLVTAGAVGFAAAVAVAGFGFVRGVERGERAAILTDPLVFGLFADDRSPVDLGFGGSIGPDDAGRVLDLLRGEARAGTVSGVYPYRRALLSTAQVDLSGRTVAVGPDPDPLPKSRPVVWGRWPAAPADAGVVLTPAGLFRLGLKEDARPEELVVYVRRVPLRVPVLGVTEKSLPNPAVSFLITEDYYLDLHRRAHPDPLVKSARSGPIPDEWLDDGRLRPPVRDGVVATFPPAQFAIKLRSQGGLVLAVEALTPPGDDPRRLKVSDWKERFQRVRQAAAAAKYPAPDDFAAPRFDEPLPPGATAAPPEAGVYNGLAAYLTESDDLIPAAAAMGKYEMANGDALRVDTRSTDQLTKVGQQAARYRTAMGWVVGVTAGVIVVLVWFLFVLRAEQQVAEVGMLKAMGMRRLGTLAVVQGLMVGGVGGAAGAAAGLPVTAPLLEWYTPGAPAGPINWDLAAAAALAATAAGAAACWTANLRASRLSPAAAIRFAT